MAVEPTFQYTPLNTGQDIRLVALGRETAYDVIRCRLVDVPISTRPAYEALSYEWGPSEHDESIYVNDALHRVRRNLYDALISLRNKASDRLLWIDALCINQANVPERNHQVQLMGTIYSQARDVLVWLGLPSNDSDVAIRYMRNITHRQVVRGSVNQNPGPQKEHGAQLDAVAAFCNSSYWHRMWIVQEIQLAQNIIIHLGEASISWDAFARALKSIEGAASVKHSDAVKQIQGSMAVKLVEYRQSKERALKHWLITCRYSLCMDARDKIYALLGLAEDCTGLLAPDYSKSLSQVYRDVIKAYMRNGVGDFDVVALSEFLQITLGNQDEAIQLGLDDLEPIWICGHLSVIISEIDEEPHDISSSETLVPLNVIRTPTLTSDIEGNISHVLVSPQNSFRILNHQVVVGDDEIRFLSAAGEESVGRQICKETPNGKNKKENAEKDRAIQVRDFVAGDGRDRVIGLAPSHARVGVMICRLPNSSISLIFRQKADQWILIGRACTFNPLYVSRDEAATLWPQCSDESFPSSLKSRKAILLRLNFSIFQRLTSQNPAMEKVQNVRALSLA
ncbi:MAG: hypothetical protein M1818_000688 [Claussenomyces sp. TS43310]|nr:MAG: hypothetical protein M1818_000688 [Claussenomyces sp. TS43310]